MLPTGSAARCTGSAPRCAGTRALVLYAHGTNPAKRYNLAALTDAPFYGRVQFGSTLLSQGSLPEFALFSSMPPSAPPGSALQALLNANTPTHNGSSLDQVYAKGFGTPHLLTNDARLAYLADALAHPDGALPLAGNVLADARLAGKDPELELARNYHAGLMPFCSSAARTFFDVF